MIEPVGGVVDRDIRIDQVETAIFRADIGFSDIGLALAQRFYLGADQHDAGL